MCPSKPKNTNREPAPLPKTPPAPPAPEEVADSVKIDGGSTTDGKTKVRRRSNGLNALRVNLNTNQNSPFGIQYPR